MKLRLKLYLALEYLTFLFLAVYLYFNQSGEIRLEEVIFFLLLLLITKNISNFFISIADISISINLPVLLPAIIILNPFWVALLAFMGTIEIQYRESGFIWYKFLFNRTMFFIATGGAALVFESVYNLIGSSNVILPSLLAVITYFIINNLLLYLAIKLSGEKKREFSFLSLSIELAKNTIVSYFLGIVFYYSYITVGKLFFILVIILIYILKDFLYSRFQQMNSFTQVVEGFLKVIDSKDHYTEGHCERVANYTYILCNELGLSNSKIERIVNMAKIHDIGKIYVDDQVLKSETILSPEEFEVMKKHSFYGYELLKNIDLLKKDLDIILHHHEHYDGTGYPDGIKGKEIPYGARVLSVGDAFDVMTTGRSYKPALSKDEVIEEFKECSGGQFDPEITRVMINLIKEGRFDDSFRDRVKDKQKQLQLSLNFD